MQHKRIPYAEFYDYDRLEKAAHDLHWEETEENEILLINLHNQLVWHLYRFDKDPRADAILYAVIEAILGEKAADITDVPWELRCVWEGGKRANVFEWNSCKRWSPTAVLDAGADHTHQGKSVVCSWKDYRKRHESHRKVDEQGCYG